MWRILTRACRDELSLSRCAHHGSSPLLRAVAVAVSPVLSYILQSFRKEGNTQIRLCVLYSPFPNSLGCLIASRQRFCYTVLIYFLFSAMYRVIS